MLSFSTHKPAMDRGERGIHRHTLFSVVRLQCELGGKGPYIYFFCFIFGGEEGGKAIRKIDFFGVDKF